MSKTKLKIVMASAEIAPFAKAGGLADVVAALPKILTRFGQEVMIITPRHGIETSKGIELERVFSQVPVKIDSANTVTCSFKKGFLDQNKKIPVYFVVQEELFGRHRSIYGYHDAQRFLFFNRAILALLEKLDYKPDIIHCHDWHSALILEFLKKEYKHHPLFEDTKTILTIHNLAFQGELNYKYASAKDKDYRSHRIPSFNSSKLYRVNFLKRGILWADLINTVSEKYREETLTKESGEGLEPYLNERKKNYFGITNGLDYQFFSPKTDPEIKANFDHDSLKKKQKNKKFLQEKFKLQVDEKIPVIGIASRITEQKGFDLLLKIASALLEEQPIQIIGVGPAHGYYRKEFKKLMKKYPKKIFITMGFSTSLASQIYAGSDMFLMPSRYEPCGLGQMISLRYGSIPIVRNTGGLSDTIEDFDPTLEHGNGFVFNQYDPMALLAAITRALTSYKYQETWQKLVKRVMRQSFSWEVPARKYLKLYRTALLNNSKSKM